MRLQPGFIDIRVQRRIAELAYHLYPFRRPIQNWRVSRHWPAYIAQPEAVAKLLRMGASPGGGPSGSMPPGGPANPSTKGPKGYPNN